MCKYVCVLASVGRGNISPELRDQSSPFCALYQRSWLGPPPAALRYIMYFRFLDNVMFALGSRVVSVLDSGAEGPGFKSQSRRCRVTVLGKLFTPIVPLFTKQQNW